MKCPCKQLLFFLLTILVSLCLSSAQEVYSFTSESAGQLAETLGNRSDLIHMKVSGPLNGADMKAIQNQNNLKTLDLRNAKILKGKVGFKENEEDEMSSVFAYLPLEELTLPASLKGLQPKALYSNAFYLKKLFVPCMVPPTCGSDAIKPYSFESCTLYVPSSEVDSYKTKEPWRNFTSIREDESATPSGPSYTIEGDTIVLQRGAGYKLTFNKELPGGAKLSVDDPNVAILKGDSIFGALVGITPIRLTVGEETDIAYINVPAQHDGYIDPYIDWSMTQAQILAKIGHYPHKDAETPPAGYDAIEFDFGNKGQKYVLYSFSKSTGLLESVIIRFTTPLDYRNRDMDGYFSERFNLQMSISGLSKRFVRGSITLDTKVTEFLAMASFKPTTHYSIDPTAPQLTFSSSKTINSRVNLFLDTEEPFAIDRGDGLKLTYGGGEYGFGDRKALPIVVAGDSIRIIGGGITKLGIQKGDLRAVSLPKDNSIKYLNLARNRLSSLDLSASPHLEHLVVADNALRVLDVRQCSELRYLSAYFNFLDELYVGGLKKLEVLYINHSKIKQIDLTGCTSLVQLWMCDNAVTHLVMPETYDNLRALFMRNTRLSIPEIETILSKLPDVTHEQITSDNKPWMRQLKLERTPGIEQIHLSTVLAKGWLPDVKGIDTSIEDTMVTSSCRVYPTISSDLLYIDRYGLTPPCKYQIVSVRGEVIRAGLLQHALEVLRIDDLPCGSYYFVFQEQGESYPFVRE
jgi:hypothetical protein